MAKSVVVLLDDKRLGALKGSGLEDKIAKSKSLGAEVIDAVLKRISEIKEAAAKEKEYLPPPEL